MKITDTIQYVGVNDHQIDLFEGQYHVPNGMAYNSYLILDEKTAVMDSVDAHFTSEWLSGLEGKLGKKGPDYLIIQHMEPDHAGSIRAFTGRFPDTIVVSNQKAFAMMDQFFDFPDGQKRQTVKNGDSLCLGKHTLNFLFAPMVHWPEVMVTYESSEKVLFSADGFGKFGANDISEPWDEEARRYYIGIVGKYGAQVQRLLKEASKLDIQIICPLHGPVLSDAIGHAVSLYDQWSSYRPETEGIVIAYTSVYGHTQEAALLLADELRACGCEALEIFDLARCDQAEAVAKAFQYSTLVFATTTYNADIFPFMRDFVIHLEERGFCGRRVGIIENGSWAPNAARTIKEMLKSCKNLEFAEPVVTLRSAMKDAERAKIRELASSLLNPGKGSAEESEALDTKAVEETAKSSSVPAASQKEDKPAKLRYVCSFCGYVYPGEELPADYVCPISKHKADAFRLIPES